MLNEMDDEERVSRHAIWLLEQALMEEEEADIMAAELIGRMGGRIMGMLEDDEDLLEDDEGANWEKIQVDIDGIRHMGDPSFKRHFRLSKTTFEALLETLANYMMDSGRIIRVRNRLDVPLLTTLWILANPDTFRSVALHFGVTPGVVHENHSIHIECFREMRAMYIKWPDTAERRHIKAEFEAYCGLPGVVGAIDGTHNVVSAPSHQADRFRNRYKSHSYNTMAVCDHNLLIRDLHVGEVGSLHDSRVFRRSPLYRKLLEDENDELLEYDEHIIGDKAYTLMDCVMVPFKNRGNLNEQQRAFNHSLCRARVRIEHAFGKAFGQWRRMKYLYSANAELAVDHIVSCFVLHNFMILNGEKLIDLDDPTVLEEEYIDIDENEEEDNEDDAGVENENFNQRLAARRLRGIEKRVQLVQQF